MSLHRQLENISIEQNISNCPNFENETIRLNEVSMPVPCCSTKEISASDLTLATLRANKASPSIEDEEPQLCIVCWHSPRDAVLLECGHGGLCVACAQRLFWRQRRCPLCRARIGHVARILSELSGRVRSDRTPRSALAHSIHVLPAASIRRDFFGFVSCS